MSILFCIGHQQKTIFNYSNKENIMDLYDLDHKIIHSENLNSIKELVERCIELDKCMDSADLYGAYLSRVNLSKGLFSYSDFSKSNLSGAKGISAVLRATVFIRTNLQGIVLEKCNLIDANFRLADLAGAIFHECNLHGANFVGANIDNVDFSNCMGMTGISGCYGLKH